MITALSMLTSGGVAALLGRDSLAAATAAQNETLNNTCSNNTCGKAVDQPVFKGGSLRGGGIRFCSAAGIDGDIGSNAARRQAMRDANIPTSQQPVSQSQNASVVSTPMQCQRQVEAAKECRFSSRRWIEVTWINLIGRQEPLRLIRLQAKYE